ncbi:MAG TPA: hypothetical protein VFI91_06895 [Longimicrobiaceae bacterium]|nr:hypothetical protein [Longimicrobiaceae bacterium]
MRTKLTALVVSLLALSACATYVPRADGAPGAPAARAAVESFLQEVSNKDYVQMGWLFGTTEGSIVERDPISDVERRMYAIANVLTHTSYTIGDQLKVPGRIGEAIRFDVHLMRGERDYLVPFTVVQGPERRWFVEQIDLAAVTDSMGDD